VRAILVDLAAAELDVDRGRVGVRNGVFTVDGNNSQLDFGAVVKDLSLARNATGTATPKNRDDYHTVGKSLQRVDIPRKAFGEVAYIQDIRMDGMLHARIVRTGNREAKLLPPTDFAAVSRLPGVVEIVRDGSFLAVVAEREEQAINAARELAKLCRWDTTELPFNESNISEWLEQAPADVKVVADRGSVDSVPADKTISASYTRPFQAHGSMSPSMAIAQRSGDQLTVWSHTQGVYLLRGAIAKLVGLDEENVRVINAEAAGCYGHNGADDAGADAAVIAMHMPGKPVRLQWSRADEFLGEPYGSAMVTKISAGLDTEGNIVNWSYDVLSGTHSIRPAGARRAGNLFVARQIATPLPLPPVGNIPQPRGGGDRNAVPLYTFANQRITKHLIPDTPIRLSALRGLGAYTNVFSIESFMPTPTSSRLSPSWTSLLMHRDRIQSTSEFGISTTNARSGFSKHCAGKWPMPASTLLKSLLALELRWRATRTQVLTAPSRCACQSIRTRDTSSSTERYVPWTSAWSSIRTVLSIKSRVASSSHQAGLSWNKSASVAQEWSQGTGQVTRL
jgi:hypothetical protein